MSDVNVDSRKSQTGVDELETLGDLEARAVVMDRDDRESPPITVTPLIDVKDTISTRSLTFRLADGQGVVSPLEAQAQAGEAGMAGGAGPNFVDQGGPVLTNVHVQLIFWGSAWSGAPTPSATAITSAVNTILTGSYMNGLYQYRGIGHGALRGTTFVTASDPPNPFSDSDVANMITSLLQAGIIPEPDDDNQILYMVVMPVGVNSSGAFIGEHSFFNYTDVDVNFPNPIPLVIQERAHYAWITNDGTLDGVTRIFSHELVESVTDPEGSAILGTTGTCSQGGWCEIGDVCEGVFGTVDGVSVQKYWSQSDNSCFLSTGPKITNKIILPETAIGGPAICSINNDRLVVGWTGTDTAHRLNILSRPNGGAFGGKVTLGETSIDGPALVFGNGRLFLAWTGSDPGRHLNVMSSTDGIHFTNKVTLSDTSITAPALSFVDGKLFLIWSGTDSNHLLNIMESTDGIHFSNKITLAESSDVHGALARHNNLFLVWTGRDSAHRLNALGSGSDDRHFRSKLTDANTSPSGLSLTNFQGDLFISWTGTDTNHHVNVAKLS